MGRRLCAALLLSAAAADAGAGLALALLAEGEGSSGGGPHDHRGRCAACGAAAAAAAVARAMAVSAVVSAASDSSTTSGILHRESALYRVVLGGTAASLAVLAAIAIAATSGEWCRDSKAPLLSVLLAMGALLALVEAVAIARLARLRRCAASELARTPLLPAGEAPKRAGAAAAAVAAAAPVVAAPRHESALQSIIDVGTGDDEEAFHSPLSTSPEDGGGALAAMDVRVYSPIEPEMTPSTPSVPSATTVASTAAAEIAIDVSLPAPTLQRMLYSHAASGARRDEAAAVAFVTRLAGRWEKDAAGTDDHGAMLRAAGLSALFRRAVRLLSRVDFALAATRDGRPALQTSVKFLVLNIAELLPCDGSDAMVKRRDMRPGSVCASLRVHGRDGPGGSATGLELWHTGAADAPYRISQRTLISIADGDRTILEDSVYTMLRINGKELKPPQEYRLRTTYMRR